MPRQRKTLTKQEWAELKEMFVTLGRSLESLAKLYRVPIEAVHRRCQREGWMRELTREEAADQQSKAIAARFFNVRVRHDYSQDIPDLLLDYYDSWRAYGDIAEYIDPATGRVKTAKMPNPPPSLPRFAATIRVSLETIADWARDYRDFREALAVAMSYDQAIWLESAASRHAHSTFSALYLTEKHDWKRPAAAEDVVSPIPDKTARDEMYIRSRQHAHDLRAAILKARERSEPTPPRKKSRRTVDS